MNVQFRLLLFHMTTPLILTYQCKCSMFSFHHLLDFQIVTKLGDLYDGQITEGTYNFTSTSQPSQIDREFEDAKGVEEVQSGSENDDVQILHEEGPPQMREEVNSVNEVHVGERVDNVKPNEKKVASGPKKKQLQELKKPNKSDEMVQVVDRYVKMKEKQAEDEKAESNVYSIGKCITVLQKMNDFSREERVKASKVFKIAENRETFLSWAAEDEQSAVMWLRDELRELP